MLFKCSFKRLFPIKRYRMKVMLLIYYLITLIFLVNKIGTINKKLQKSFDEIFEEGWEEKEQNLDDKHKSNDLDDQGNLSPHHQGKTTDQNVDEHQKGDQHENDQQKMKIIRKFIVIKEKLNQRGKLSTKERNKYERIIAKKLGIYRTKIYRWKKQFGMSNKISKDYSDQQKRETIRKFHAIKEKIKQKGRKYSKKEWVKIDAIIGKKLEANRDKIYKWKKELRIKCRGMIKDKSTKIEIVQKFDEIKNAYKQKGKHSRQEWEKKYCKISKKLGISCRTIQKWRKEFGISRKRKSYTNDQKLVIMKQYWEMKRTNPKISEAKIAKALQIAERNLRRWKGKFRKEDI